MKADRREFRFIDGSSKKFWAIELDGASFTVHFGRIGTAGQAKEKTLGSEDAAKREYDKLIAEKTKGGYVEVEGSGASSTIPPPAPRKAVAKAAPAAEEPPAAAAETAADGPAGQAAVAEHVGRLERRVRLSDEDWAQVRWRPRKPVKLPEPKPFDFEACLKQASTYTGWGHYRAVVAK